MSRFAVLYLPTPERFFAHFTDPSAAPDKILYIVCGSLRSSVLIDDITQIARPLPDIRVLDARTNPVNQVRLTQARELAPVHPSAGADRDDTLEVVILFVMVGDAKDGDSIGKCLIIRPVTAVTHEQVAVG